MVVRRAEAAAAAGLEAVRDVPVVQVAADLLVLVLVDREDWEVREVVAGAVVVDAAAAVVVEAEAAAARRLGVVVAEALRTRGVFARCRSAKASTICRCWVPS